MFVFSFKVLNELGEGAVKKLDLDLVDLVRMIAHVANYIIRNQISIFTESKNVSIKRFHCDIVVL